MLERKRQWQEMKTLKQYNDSFEYFCSENMASCGRFLLSDFIPKKNDLYSLKKVRDDIVKIQDSVDDQLSRLKKFDDTLFVKHANGSSRETLKKGKIHHHQFNQKMFEDILSLKKKIIDVLTKLNAAETKIKDIF